MFALKKITDITKNMMAPTTYLSGLKVDFNSDCEIKVKFILSE